MLIEHRTRWYAVCAIRQEPGDYNSILYYIGIENIDGGTLDRRDVRVSKDAAAQVRLGDTIKITTSMEWESETDK